MASKIKIEKVAFEHGRSKNVKVGDVGDSIRFTLGGGDYVEVSYIDEKTLEVRSMPGRMSIIPQCSNVITVKGKT